MPENNEAAKDNKLPQLLKWIGYITAILSFLGTIYGLGKFAYDRAETNRRVDALLSVEAVQLQGRDYESAWQSIEQAAKLKPDAAKVRAAQDALAILWLDDIDLQRTQKFSAISQKLIPVISREIAAARPGTPQHADLLAHLGWAYYLQVRESTSEVDPEITFKQAIAEDPNNPYAQAMWGYFLLTAKYTEDYLGDAKKHFAAAISAQRAGDYVRHLQTLGLSDCHSDPCIEELLRVASAMRKENRTLLERPTYQLFGQYWFEFRDGGPRAAHFAGILAPADHLATFHWLFDNLQMDKAKEDERTFYTAFLQEAAGDREGAIANYRLCIANDKPHSGSMWEAATAAIKRLAH